MFEKNKKWYLAFFYTCLLNLLHILTQPIIMHSCDTCGPASVEHWCVSIVILAVGVILIRGTMWVVDFFEKRK